MIELLLLIVFVINISNIVNTYTLVKKYAKDNNIEFNCSTIEFIFGGFIKHINLIHDAAQNIYNQALNNKIKMKFKNGVEPINKENANKYLIGIVTILIGAFVFGYFDINYLSQDYLSASITRNFFLLAVVYIIILLSVMLTGGRLFLTTIDKLLKTNKKLKKLK